MQMYLCIEQFKTNKMTKSKIKTYSATICGQSEVVSAVNKTEAYKILFSRVRGLTKKDLKHPRNSDLQLID